MERFLFFFFLGGERLVLGGGLVGGLYMGNI